jgi:hypothetical protein
MSKLNILDFEASALKFPSFPTQVAIIKEDGSTFDRFIKPTRLWISRYNWDPESEKIHGVPLNDLVKVGTEPSIVAAQLNEFIDGEDVFCDGGEYDVNWANELFLAANIKREFRIASISELFDTETLTLPMWQLKQKAAEKLQLPEHDALNDVKIIQTAVKWKRNNYVPL